MMMVMMMMMEMNKYGDDDADLDNNDGDPFDCIALLILMITLLQSWSRGALGLEIQH